MINAHINEERAAPLWAAVGVPLLGVPLLVALLSLVAPASPAPASDEGATVTSEHVVDVRAADRAVSLRSDCLGQATVQS